MWLNLAPSPRRSLFTVKYEISSKINLKLSRPAKVGHGNQFVGRKCSKHNCHTSQVCVIERDQAIEVELCGFLFFVPSFPFTRNTSILKLIPMPHVNRVLPGAKLWPIYMSNVPFWRPNTQTPRLCRPSPYFPPGRSASNQSKQSKRQDERNAKYFISIM